MTKAVGGILIALVTSCGGPVGADRKAPAGSAKPSDTMTVDTTVSVPASAPHADVIRAAGDTAAIAATPEELAYLAAAMIIPVQDVVASQLRDSYVEPRNGHSHEALDIMAPRGTPVVSATDGRVLKLFNSVAGGTMVYAADTSDRFILMYAHLDRYADGVVDGMPVTRGQLLGYVGSTGDASAAAPHLHFAIARGRPSVAWWKGTPVNPYPLFVHPLAPDPTVGQARPYR